MKLNIQSDDGETTKNYEREKAKDFDKPRTTGTGGGVVIGSFGCDSRRKNRIWKKTRGREMHRVEEGLT